MFMWRSFLFVVLMVVAQFDINLFHYGRLCMLIVVSDNKIATFFCSRFAFPTWLQKNHFLLFKFCKKRLENAEKMVKFLRKIFKIAENHSLEKQMQQINLLIVLSNKIFSSFPNFLETHLKVKKKWYI